jgi:hypothetical protein
MTRVVRQLRATTTLGLLVVVALALTLGSSSRAASTSAAGAAGASAAFTDPSGDAPGSTDITAVNVSVDEAGNVHFQISIPGSTTQANGGGVEIHIDTDLNGAPDYLVFYAPGSSTATLYSCNNTTPCSGDDDPTFQSSYSAGPTFQMSRGAIGTLNVTRIQFLVYTLFNDTNYYYDAAPDSGWYTFDIGPAVTGVTVDSSSLTPTPAHPTAGRSYTLGFQAMTNIGTPLPTGTVQCTATAGGSTLTGSGTVTTGTGSCTWQIPSTAGGKAFHAHVVVSFPGAATQATFDRTDTVVGIAMLRFGSVRAPRVVAGHLFTLGAPVVVHQPGLADKRVQGGSVNCAATAGGHAVRAVTARLGAKGAQCTWFVPATAKGKTLRATVTVHAQGLAARKSFAFGIH